MANLFREAKQLLDTKSGSEMSEEERDLVASAIAQLLILPQYNDLKISEGLEDLAQIIEGAREYSREKGETRYAIR